MFTLQLLFPLLVLKSTHQIGGFTGPRLGLNLGAKKEMCAPNGYLMLVVQLQSSKAHNL